MQKELKRIYLFAAVCMTTVMLFPSCARHDTRGQERTALRVKMTVVTPQANGVHARYVGVVEPVHETPLSMQTAGRVTAVNAKNGDAVRKGQVILRIDSMQAQHALESAEAALRQAQDGYERVRQVHAKGAVTDQKMVEIESQLARAQSLYNAARQQVGEHTLKAPCDGVLSGLEVEKGQSIMPGMRLCSILDKSAFSVRFTVPEAEIGKIAISRQPSTVSGEMECAAADTVLPVRITEKSMKANPITHTYEVKARVIGGADVLMTGMVGKVLLVESRKSKVESESQEEIVIPASCVLLKPEGPTVWVAEEGKAVRRAIAIDGYQAEGVRVKSGLQAGDSLITEGYQKLYEGCMVKGEDQ